MVLTNKTIVRPVPEFIDPDFAKTSPKCSFSITKNERFGLVFAKTGHINSGTDCIGLKLLFYISIKSNSIKTKVELFQ
jgi:hypothetical protein